MLHCSAEVEIWYTASCLQKEFGKKFQIDCICFGEVRGKKTFFFIWKVKNVKVFSVFKVYIYLLRIVNV